MNGSVASHSTSAVDDLTILLAESVCEGLRDLLGEKPSRMITKIVAKRLYSRLGFEFWERSNYSFFDYLRDARTER